MAVGLLSRVAPWSNAAAGVAIAVGIAAAVGSFALAQGFSPRVADARFVRECLKEHWREPGSPTVYWPGSDVGTVWFGVGANSYFTLDQLAGNTFSRENAVEGDRRLNLVFPFEIDRYRRDYGPLAVEVVGEDLTGLAGLPPPAAEQFRELARQTDIDFLVLPTDFGGAIATNGRVWVYRVGRSAAPRG